MDHCRHCADPDDPRHAEPGYAKAEADCAFYENPENLRIHGPAHKRAGHPGLTEHVPVRFNRDTIAAIRVLSDADGMTVSAWVRRLVDREIKSRNVAERP
jgi:hypothetical protein